MSLTLKDSLIGTGQSGKRKEKKREQD
jgi:hypothetical protein